MNFRQTLYVIYILFASTTYSQSLKLVIKGQKEVETKIIDSISYKNSFRDFKSLLAEKDSLKNKLHKIGYIEAKEIASKKINDTSYIIEYALNEKYNYIHIYYKNIPLEIIKQISNTINDIYFELPFYNIESKLNFVNKELANQGSPFQSIQLSSIEKKDRGILKAFLTVKDSENRIIDNIKLNGYEKFPKSFVKRFLKIKKGAEFNLQEIKNKTEALNQLTFANQLKEPEVLFTQDSTTLYLYVEKKPSNTFDGFLGFGTNDKTNKIEFDGYLNLNLINNLNFGESFRLLYKSDEIDQTTFEANIKLPYVFKSPIGIEAQLNIFRKDSSFTNVNQFAKLFYQVNPRSKVLAGVSLTQSSNLLDNNTTLITVDDYDTAFYNIGYSFKKNQLYNNLFPVNTLIEVEGGIGSRNTSTTDQKQEAVLYNMFKIFNLNDRNSIYIRLNGAFLFSENFVFNELYRFGGINSIRGFEENSLFASGYSLINTEYRYQISNTLYINSIFDAAYFENELRDTRERLLGVGFGFGLLTNAGVLKLNYANGKPENQKFKFSDSKIHISLTANF